MTKRADRRITLSGIALVAAVTLPGCGGSAPQAPPKVLHKGVYTSAADCAAGGVFERNQCEAAIDKAIAEHERSAPTYTSLKSCETAEGADRCERSDPKRYRPRLLAYLVTEGQPAVAIPLYATPNPEPGFRQLDKKILAASDESLNFSVGATSIAEINANAGKGGGGGFL